jgi:hypothetical protein
MVGKISLWRRFFQSFGNFQFSFNVPQFPKLDEKILLPKRSPLTPARPYRSTAAGLHCQKSQQDLSYIGAFLSKLQINSAKAQSQPSTNEFHWGPGWPSPGHNINVEAAAHCFAHIAIISR